MENRTEVNKNITVTVVNGMEESGVLERRRFKISLIIQGFALMLGLFFTIGEAVKGSVSSEFAYSAVNTAYRNQGLISLAGLLSTLVVCLYFLVGIEAAQSKEGIKSFVKRHIPNLQMSNFIFDLAAKYTAVAVLVLALKPELIPALLLVFLADYVVQGRIFILPTKTKIIVATALLGFSYSQISTGNYSMLGALSAFCVLSAASATYLVVGMIRIRNATRA